MFNSPLGSAPPKGSPSVFVTYRVTLPRVFKSYQAWENSQLQLSQPTQKSSYSRDQISRGAEVSPGSLKATCSGKARLLREACRMVREVGSVQDALAGGRNK